MKYLIYTLFGLLMILIATPVFAQGGPPATPIDGGLSILLIAGGAYGLKKLKDKKGGSN